jgi:Putative Actinobacterial Holin-X, holin superfamily III
VTKRTQREPELRTKEAPRSSRPDCPDPALFAEIKARAAELREELRAYARIRIAQLKLAAGEKLLTVLAAVLGVVMAMAFLASAVVFLLAGIAGWLGEATGKPWLGSLITGGAAIALIAVAFLIGRSRLKAATIPDEAKAKPGERECAPR